MHICLERTAPDDLHGDVAIIGAGAAGITMARALLAAGLRVVLLESGGLDYEAETAALNAGENVGQEYYSLQDARLRFFGGTTAIWGGRCAEFDPIDFERRAWVPHSGWPFSHDELRPHYDAARRLLGLPGRSREAALRSAAAAMLPAFSPHELRTPSWLFDTRFDRFSFQRSHDLVAHPRCTVVTRATVREIVAAASGRGIERLDVRSLGGRRLRVQARHYVLAAGGIENPRLLLASRSVMPDGLGNGEDQVGRYFMEHPHARGGRIVGGPAWQLLRAFAKHRIGDDDFATLLTPSPERQAAEGLLNTSLTIAGRRPLTAQESWGMRAYLHAKHSVDPNRMGRTLWKGVKRGVGWAQRRTDPLRPWLLNRVGRLDVALVVRAEQAPNPESRVQLARERDAIGMPRASLDWRMTDLDVDSVRGLVRALGRETRRLGLGTVEEAAWLADPGRQWVSDPLISAHPIGGYHHMGTTRMSDDPQRGVTDGFGRVHGIDNLFVAGSSLFPTGGWANPTLTIIALALRTAERIVNRGSPAPIVAAVSSQAFADAS